MESRTQGLMPRPRTQKKKSEAKAKDSPSKDRPSRRQEQECSRPRSRTQRKCSNKSLPKKILLVLELRSRGFYVQAYADDLAVLVTGTDLLWIRDMA